VGRRNLLTTASSGSANGLQVISDRLADNFSIIPGHHGTGDNGDDEGEDGGARCDGNDEVEEGKGEGGGIMAKSFAIFECRGEGGSQSRCARAEGGSASPISLVFSMCHPIFVYHLMQVIRKSRETLIKAHQNYE